MRCPREDRFLPKIKVAILGVGNVASALVQSVFAKQIPGLWHKRVGGHNFNDVEIVAAFDVDKRKIGVELSDAIFQAPNVGPKFSKVPKTKIIVKTGILKDLPPPHLADNAVETDSIVNVSQGKWSRHCHLSDSIWDAEDFRCVRKPVSRSWHQFRQHDPINCRGQI